MDWGQGTGKAEFGDQLGEAVGLGLRAGATHEKPKIDRYARSDNFES